MSDGDCRLLRAATASELASFELLEDTAEARAWPGGGTARRAPRRTCAGLFFALAAAACFAFAVFVYRGLGGSTAALAAEPGQPASQAINAAAAPADEVVVREHGAPLVASQPSAPLAAKANDIAGSAPLGRTARLGLSGTSMMPPASSTAAITTSSSSLVEGRAPAALALTPPVGAATVVPNCKATLWDSYHRCEAATPEVRELRCRPWPAKGRPPAPRISRILYINLARDLRRNTWMSAQLQSIPPNVMTERVEGIDMGRARMDTAFEEIRNRGFSEVAYPRVKGKWSVAGCTFSHLSILRKLREQVGELLARREVWLILEDDAILTPQILYDWEHLWPYIPNEWDIMRLGWFGDYSCTAHVNKHVDLALWRDPPPDGPCRYCGSHAYVVNPASIQKVIHRLESSRLMHVDCLLGAPTPPLEDPTAVPPLLSFVFRPSLARQNETFPTDRRDV